MSVQRFDSAVPIRDPVVDDQTKFLCVYRVPIARAMVQRYRRSDGSETMEAKLPSEILSDSTVASANNRPITNDHPNELVTKDNSKKYMVGYTGSNAHVEGDMLFNDVFITDADTIDQIVNGGKRELSIGFETEVVPEKGEYNGVGYDSVQKDININHVAVVKKGRAGHSVRLLGDSAEATDDFDEEKEGNSMDYKVVHLSDGSDVTVAADDVSKITKLDADNSANAKKIAEIDAQIKALQAEKEKLQGSNDAAKKNADAAQAKADSAEQELEKIKKKYAGDALDKALEARMDLIEKVKPYVGDSFDFKGKSERDMKVEAIKSVYDSVDLKEKSDDYVNAYFDSLAEHKPSVVGYQANDSAEDSAKKDPFYARQHMYKGGK